MTIHSARTKKLPGRGPRPLIARAYPAFNIIVQGVGSAAGGSAYPDPFSSDFSLDYGPVNAISQSFNWFPMANSTMPEIIPVKREMVSY